MMSNGNNLFEKLLILAMALCLLSSCSNLQPDLSRLYSTEHLQPFYQNDIDSDFIQPPVVIIPGIVSSTLVDENDKEVWFGSLSDTLFSQYKHLKLEIDPITLHPKPSDIRSHTLPEKVLFFDFYGSLFKVLEDYGNYKPTPVGTPFTINERRYYKFDYDWRYGNVETVKKLDAFIEKIRADYGDPHLKVDIISHSMGGLVARYYMRYGPVDVLDDNHFPITQAGAKKVRRLIQLDKPNLGSAASAHQLIQGYKILFSTVPVEVLSTMPSLYQLLPHPINTWLITMEGKPLKRDLYDASIWRRLEWGIFNPEVVERIIADFENEAQGRAYVNLLQAYFEKHIERARRFVWSLTVPVPNINYQIVAFGGNCSPTPARMVVEDIDGQSYFRLWPHEIKHPIKGVDYEQLMLEPGDGRVTKPSMLARHYLHPQLPRHKYSFFPLDYAFFLCHNHGQLTGNINFQDNLLNVLLENDRDEFKKVKEVEKMM